MRKLSIKYLVFGILGIIIFAYYILHTTYYIPPTLAVTAPCPTQSPYPRVITGLISTNTITGNFSNPTGTCVVDSERASFRSTEIPTYDSLKSQYFDKSKLGPARRYTLTGNQSQSSTTSPINLTDITPIAEWKFDEGTGVAINDSSGNGRNGTFTGSVMANFDGTLDGGFATDCTGPTTADYFTGVQGQALRIYSGSNTNACVQKDLRASLPPGVAQVPVGYSVYFYGLGYVRASIVDSTVDSTNDTITYLEDVDADCKTEAGQNEIYTACNGGASYSSWKLFRLVVFKIGTQSSTVYLRLFNRTLASGAGNSGVYDTAGQYRVPGKSGSALHFNGFNDYIVNLTNNISTSTYTISAWVYPTGNSVDSAGGDIVVINNRGTRLHYNSGGTLCLYQYDGGSFRNLCTEAGALQYKTWQYIAATYDGTTAKIYINTNPPWQSTSLTAPVAWGTGSSIGNLSGGSRRFMGLIDGVRVFSRALTVSEISAEYSNTSLSADKLYHITSDLTINTGGDIDAKSTGVIFVQGNLNINTNLTNAYNTTGLIFVVKGNVAIDKSVTQVNAVIISQGTIYTATDASTPCSTSSVTASQLVINGSLISLDVNKPIRFCRKLAGIGNNTAAAEVINQQPKYLVILKDIVADTLQTWSELP